MKRIFNKLAFKRAYNRYISSIPTAVLLTVVVSVFLVFTIELWLKSIPEIFPWGAELGNIISNLSMAIISSFIFYYLVVHLQKVKDGINIDYFVYEKNTQIISIYVQQVSALAKACDFKLKGTFVEEDELLELFSKIKPQDKAPLASFDLKQAFNWLHYFDDSRVRTQKIINKLIEKLQFLDSDLIKLLSQIDDCSHFHISEQLPKSIVGNSLENWADTFYQYSQHCKALDSYNRNHLIRKL